MTATITHLPCDGDAADRPVPMSVTLFAHVKDGVPVSAERTLRGGWVALKFGDNELGGSGELTVFLHDDDAVARLVSALQGVYGTGA